jgi:hypothetical protein
VSKKPPAWLLEDVGWLVTNFLEDLYAIGKIDIEHRTYVYRLLANAGLPSLLPRCKGDKLSLAEQETLVHKISERLGISYKNRDYLKETICARLNKPTTEGPPIPPSGGGQALSKPLPEASDKGNSTMSNGYLSYHMYVQPGKMPPEEHVRQVIAGFNTGSGFVFSKNNKLFRLTSKEPASLETVMKKLKQAEASSRIFAFGMDVNNDMQQEDIQPFVLLEPKEGANPLAVACLDGDYSDKDKVPFSRNYTVFQQDVKPVLLRSYSATLSDIELLREFDDTARFRPFIAAQKGILTLMMPSGETLRISAPDCPCLVTDWGFGSVDLNPKMATSVATIKTSVPTVAAGSKMRALTDDEVTERVLEGMDEDEARKIQVPDDGAGVPWEEPKKEAAVLTAEQAEKVLAPAALKSSTSETAISAAMAKAHEQKTATVKWVRIRANSKVGSAQHWYAEAFGAKNNDYRVLPVAVQTAISQGKTPWIQPSAKWLADKGRKFIAGNPDCWSSGDAPPDQVVERGSPDVVSPDKGETVSPVTPSTSPVAVPTTPSAAELKKFVENGVKAKYDLNNRKFDDEEYQAIGKRRTAFTGEKGLGGGIRDQQMMLALDEDLLSLMKDHPTMALAYIRELQHRNYGLMKALAAQSAARNAKAA